MPHNASVSVHHPLHFIRSYLPRGSSRPYTYFTTTNSNSWNSTHSRTSAGIKCHTSTHAICCPRSPCARLWFVKCKVMTTSTPSAGQVSSATVARMSSPLVRRGLLETQDAKEIDVCSGTRGEFRVVEHIGDTAVANATSAASHGWRRMSRRRLLLRCNLYPGKVAQRRETNQRVERQDTNKAHYLEEAGKAKLRFGIQPQSSGRTKASSLQMGGNSSQTDIGLIENRLQPKRNNLHYKKLDHYPASGKRLHAIQTFERNVTPGHKNFFSRRTTGQAIILLSACFIRTHSLLEMTSRCQARVFPSALLL